MADIDISVDVDLHEIEFTKKEKEKLLKMLDEEGFLEGYVRKEKSGDFPDSRSYTEIQLFNFIDELRKNRQFIKSETIEKMRNIFINSQ